MDNMQKEALIRQYIDAYNNFDIEGMLSVLHPNIVFRNYSNNVMEVETTGIEQFRQLARQGAKLFAQRCQTVEEIQAADSGMKATIEFEGVLADGMPNGLKAGSRINLKGLSLFEFKDGRISLIEDYS
ncbi:nuclear transport factor 2 family protein [Paenibacillus sambharensis]|uniref:Nuclear transport factor 2 family protein n=1 Tax=Paenibacillus sambharensis TaxID=1803190 RepID=A0A2W1LS47_9BACL|nr:nuclear transport factor 2 family protein [Paenibacillus sambharensis]PZD97314.1 nuclear transport factor 2 family protein [Paenibacillus sambharensis]